MFICYSGYWFVMNSFASKTSLCIDSIEEKSSVVDKHKFFSIRMPTPKRKWEIYPGRNRFCCEGRIVMAKNIGVFCFTLGLIISTSLLFFLFDCPYLAIHVTLAIPIIGGALFLFVIATLLWTSFSDPGIIPRATAEEAIDLEKQIEVPTSPANPTYRPPPRTKEVVIRGQVVKLKFCFTCKIFRPPRASHCSICDNCVDGFDHHCPWIGNCVGRRNYRYFYSFIVSLAFLCVYILACSVTHLVLVTRESKVFLDAVRESPTSVIVAIVCFFSVWSVLGLAGFHTYLTSSNQTTNEDIKGAFSSKQGQNKVNPYNKGGIFANCFFVLCGPLPPSYIDRRGFVISPDVVIIPRVNTSIETVDSTKVDIELATSATSFNRCEVKLVNNRKGISEVTLLSNEKKGKMSRDAMEHQPGSNLPQPTLSTFSSQSLELLRENTMINTELDLDPLEEPNDLPISRNVSLT